MAASSQSGRFLVKPITDIGAWRAIAREWDCLLRVTSGYSPLQSFDFLATWWECMAGERALWILVFYDDRECIAGIAPLQISPRRMLGRRYRVVEFLGMTEDILLPTVLFPERDRAQLGEAFVDYLAERQAEWDLIELDELATDDPLAAELRRLSQRCGLMHREQPFHPCPFLDMQGQSADSFWAARSRKLLKNVRASERKLAASGPVAVRTYSSSTDIGVGFGRLLELEKLSWKRRAAVGVSSDVRYETFYARLLEVFVRNHGARVMILEVGGRALAATLAIVFDGIYCSLLIVHDESYAQFSPGTVLEFREMQELWQSGSVRRYEFLGGALNNKLRWTTTAATTLCIRSHKPQLVTRLMDMYEYRGKPLAKRVLRAAGL